MLTTQGCVEAETECPLEPIFVKPPPVQPVTDPDDVCTRYPGECDDSGGGGGWTGGTGGAGGTGGGGAQDYTGEPTTDGDCKGIEGCDDREATSEEVEKAKAAASKIRSDGFCGQIRANAFAMIDRGLRVWTNKLYAVNKDGKEAVLVGHSYFVYTGANPGPTMWLWTGSIGPHTIAHEAAHGLPNMDGSGSGYYQHNQMTPMGVTMENAARTCSGN
jgi:hypothetical protein